jgi:hypothetical protein
VVERQLLLAGVENVPQVLDPHGRYRCRRRALPERKETPVATTERGLVVGIWIWICVSKLQTAVFWVIFPERGDPHLTQVYVVLENTLSKYRSTNLLQ